MAKQLTDAERASIVDAIRAGKPRNDIAREVGRSQGTITRIAKAEGLSFDRTDTKCATEARRADNAAKRAVLISEMYDNAMRLNRQMFSPCKERKAMVVGTGEGMSRVQIVDIKFEEPPFADKRNIAVSVKVLADGAKGLEAVDESGAEEAKGMLERLIAGVRSASPVPPEDQT